MRKLILFSFIFVYTTAFCQNSLEKIVLDFKTGDTQLFSTKGHPKSSNVNFQLSLPKSWAIKEGKRPHVVKVFSSPGEIPGTALVCVIEINDLPLKQSKGFTLDQKITNILNTISTFPAEGHTIIFSKKTKYDGLPGFCWGEVFTDSRSGGDFITKSFIHSFIKSNYLVSVIITYTGIISNKVADIMEKDTTLFNELCILIGNSIIIDNN